MKNQPTKSQTGALSRLFKATFIAGVLPASLLLLSIQSSRAGSATWNLNPTSGDWNTASNWTPATVPDGPNDIATFGVSNTTRVGFCVDQDFEVNGIVFNAGASAFTIYFSITEGAEAFIISGVGITNNSGITQNFTLLDCGDFPIFRFTNSATAGDQTVFTAAGTDGGITEFHDTSTAGNATLIASSFDSFFTAILFFDDSTGGTARVEVFAGDFSDTNGSLDITAHNAPGMAIGSIEGDGLVFLGANNLTVGSNNLSTIFSGVIQDGGSLTKIGTGTLTLTNANTYVGGTTIEEGKLVVNNISGSSTGTGPVQVDAGTLGGTGTIAGAVTVGTGSGAGAVLAPGESTHKAGTLTMQSTLTFNSDATYKFQLKTKRVIADKVVANGVTISGAQFSFVSCGSSALTPGTVFTVIDNTAATTPIAGTFSNLADGSTFTAGSNTYQVSYEGGDGNDLTLTVQ